MNSKTHRPKIVMIIPYFGKKPDYFHLWLNSALHNKNYNFYIYTDIDFGFEEFKNIKIINTSFDSLKKRFEQKLGKLSLKTPYKLCEYRPAYGYVFEEDIKEFDFWGFCDIDLIFGDLDKFITVEMLNNYDKLFYHGHFTLMKNTKFINHLYKKKYQHVLTFEQAANSKISKHFDENGTIAYAFEFEPQLKFYFEWTFYDAPSDYYQLVINTDTGYKETCAYWNSGVLTLYDPVTFTSNEIMYIHLQKRKMLNIPTSSCESFAIWRNEFIETNVYNPEKLLSEDIDFYKQKEFNNLRIRNKCRYYIDLFLNGWLKYYLERIFYKTRTQINYKKISNDRK